MKPTKEHTIKFLTDPSEIEIDTSAIPAHVREEIAAATLEAVKHFLAQPGGKEFLDNKIKQKEKEKKQ